MSLKWRQYSRLLRLSSRSIISHGVAVVDAVAVAIVEAVAAVAGGAMIGEGAGTITDVVLVATDCSAAAVVVPPAIAAAVVAVAAAWVAVPFCCS